MPQPVNPPRALRGEIENVLARKIDGVHVAGTLTWLTAELGGRGEVAEGQVWTELTDMEREGLVTMRRTRAGQTLWKLTDRHHAAWQKLSQANLNLNRRS